MTRRTSLRGFAASGLVLTALAMLAGCSTMTGQPATPLSIKREDPGVVLCMSERAGGGIRIVGKLDKGIHPITQVTLQYKLAKPSERVPATSAYDVLELTGARSEKVPYRKGSDEVSYTIDADAARALRGKVLWYRWIVEFSRGGRAATDRTDIHRTSLEEAGHPRSADSLGPDSSVGVPTSVRRR